MASSQSEAEGTNVANLHTCGKHLQSQCWYVRKLNRRIFHGLEDIPEQSKREGARGPKNGFQTAFT